MIIAMDMDGTICKDDKTITEFTLNILKRLKSMGHIPIVCTGRGKSTIGPTILTVCDYGVLGTGSTIYDLKSDQCLYSENIDPTIITLIHEKGLNPDIDIDYFSGDEIFTDQYTYDHIEYYVQGNAGLAKMIRGGRTIVDDPYTYMKESNRQAQRVNIFIVDDDLREQWKLWLKSLGLEVASSASTNIEVTAPHVNKGSGLKWLCHHFDWDMNDVMMFGDASNDEPALDIVGIPVVMKNASDTMKRKYTYITACDNNHDGVGWFLKEYFHIETMV